MTVFCVGVDHVSAPLALRARLSVPLDQMDSALETLLRDVPALGELAILSTCNRVECYASTLDDEQIPDNLATAFARSLAAHRGMDFEAFEPSLRIYVGPDAERHLCRVAAGLESLVIGESEILAQVIESCDRGRLHGAVGANLSALFDIAIRTGKRARAETALGRNPSSVSSVAMKVAEELAPRPQGNRALFVGAGKMGRIAVERLSGNGRWHVTVTSRTTQNATDLATRSGVSVAPYERLAELIAEADVVFTATAAPVVLVEAPMVRAAMATRPERPLVFIDVAVPPNVDAAVRAIDGVRLFDVDELRPRVDAGLEERRREVPRVEAIIEEELGLVAQRQRGAALLQIVHQWRRSAEDIRQRELRQLLQSMPALEPEVAQRLEQMSRSLVNRLLAEPSSRLRAEAANGHAEEYAAFARRLFLPEETAQSTPPT